MQSNQYQRFYMVVTDSQAKLFNVVGPITDDTEVVEKVLKAQKLGRVVNCHNPGAVERSRDELIKSVAESTGHTYSDRSIG